MLYKGSLQNVLPVRDESADEGADQSAQLWDHVGSGAEHAAIADHVKLKQTATNEQNSHSHQYHTQHLYWCTRNNEAPEEQTPLAQTKPNQNKKTTVTTTKTVTKADLLTHLCAITC